MMQLERSSFGGAAGSLVWRPMSGEEPGGGDEEEEREEELEDEIEKKDKDEDY